jgi:SAM-dependent methyltransferase
MFAPSAMARRLFGGVSMGSGSDGLEEVAGLTLQHYDERAESFWEGTRGHDVTQNIAAMLSHIRNEPPFTLLDLGCGPGRDLKALSELGHVAIGLDGAPRFVEMARIHSGCEVWLQDFLALDLPKRHFDGIFANASLFHVPSRELPRVLRELHAGLKPEGILFSSIPHGADQEGWSDGRYGVFHDPESWGRFGSAAGFVELERYYRPSNAPPNAQPWLASVWRRG